MEQNNLQNDENNQNNSQEQKLSSESANQSPNVAHKEEPKKLEGEELKAAILSQIEFYFSQENLSSDHFLVSQMDSNKYVPLTVIENFGKVKSLTTDSNLIIEVLSNSKVVELDESKTKIKSKILDQQRTTIILRDILADSTVQEIEAIFANFEEKVTEVKFDIGNTCFVSFSSEKAALAALNFVKGQTYRGSPIKARIKNETILRSCNAVKPVQTNHYYSQQYQPYQYVPGAWNISRQHQEFDPEFRPNRGDSRSKPNQRKRKDNNAPNSNNSNNSSRKSNNGHNHNDKRQGRSGAQKKKGNTGHANRKNSADFQLGGSYFPPLTSTKSPNSDSDTESNANEVNSRQTWSQVVNVKSKPAVPIAPSPSVNNQSEENNSALAESASN